MKFRSLAVLGSLIAAGLAVTPVSAYAAATDPVTDLRAAIVQTPGSNKSWTVTGSWTKNPDASQYRAFIAYGSADGSQTEYAYGDTGGSTISLESDKLAGDGHYLLAVVSMASNSLIATAPFTVPALDKTAPKATYTLNRRAAVLIPDFTGTEFVRRAPFVVTETGTDEPITARQLVSDEGKAPIPWPAGEKTAALIYATPGVHSPRVRVTDAFGNTKDVLLPTVTVIQDSIAPSISIKTPAKAGKVASWRVVRGTASDAGTGLYMVGAFVMQKRGKLWWAYDFAKKKWVKGYSKYKKTSNKSKATPAFVKVRADGTWATPRIKGLKKGSTVIEAMAIDMEINMRGAQVGPRTLR